MSIKLRTSAPLLPSRSRELPHQIFRLGISGTFGFCLGIGLPFACANDQILSDTKLHACRTKSTNELVWVWIFLDVTELVDRLPLPLEPTVVDSAFLLHPFKDSTSTPLRPLRR